MSSPYIPNTAADRRAILDATGAKSVEELFADIPQAYRNPELRMPPPLSEAELKRELAALARRNADLGEYACFLGAGAYHHFIPSVVPHIISRGEFATSYTPYQPEVSQGTLQAMYEFQSLVCQLTGMDVANGGMYDGATALAEAALMACRITSRNVIAYTNALHPRYLDVLRTYLESQGFTLVITSGASALPPDTAAVIVQSPNFYGCVEDWETAAAVAHRARALLIAVFDAIALGLFRPPGDFAADIAVGEGQPLGVAPSFGGPYVGLFAARMQHVRQMPGRLAGRTTDTQGREGFVLTLQTREQHIRRERATSNICTSETLVAIATAAYLAAMGRRGLRRIAELCYHKAHYAAERIRQLPGYALAFQDAFFKEFVVRCPAPPRLINQRLFEQGIIGGLDVSDRIPNGMLLCVTEMNTRQEIDRLVDVLRTAGGR
ncbi:MAG: aminomethyl-transferring glycine dehydrogenase subunit GcvPA [Chloroflexi bacterium]|nr:aminomethyl-transferring glycine dehydrogenase subunit GcvPA [Chloroflexota bacterium]